MTATDPVAERLDRMQASIDADRASAQYADRSYSAELARCTARSIRLRALRAEAAEDNPASRRRDLALIHLARNQTGLDDETYRCLLWEVAEERSAAGLLPSERAEIIRQFEARGWKRQPPSRHRRPTSTGSRDALLSKIGAQLAELARIQGASVAWSYADQIAKNQSGVDACRFADSGALRKVVAALAYQIERLRRRKEIENRKEERVER